MLWDKLCWLLALLALSSGGLPPSNEPLSAPRIFLSFKGKALKILLCVCVCVTQFVQFCVSLQTCRSDHWRNGHFCHHVFYFLDLLWVNYWR